MNLLEITRCASFWIVDALKGHKVKSALQTLRNCEDGIWNDEQIKNYQNNKINDLLYHAKTTVAFYGNQTDTVLEKWPIVNKNILRANGDSIISSNYQKDRLIRMSTSGSTGTPFTCFQNIEKKRHVNAETIYYNGKVGFNIGRRIIYLRSIVSEVQKSPMKQIAQNIFLLDCNDLSDEGIKEKLAFIVKYSKNSGAMLIGYASTFTAFKNYFEKYGYDDAIGSKIYGVVSGSEILYDATRYSIEKAFNCRCVSRYANEENGFLGQDENDNNIFIYNRANYYFEILKFESDEPAQENEVGRIIVTDLNNFAMPMIRYDTGDIGAFVRVKHLGRERYALGFFGGRIVDCVTDSYGNIVSPHAITNLMWKYNNVKQFQLIQKKKGLYKISLNAKKEDINIENLIDEYRSVFGIDASFLIEFCDDIPVLQSGKRRYIVNEEETKK